jgi:hypothetical protein
VGHVGAPLGYWDTGTLTHALQVSGRHKERNGTTTQYRVMQCR